MFFNFEAIKLIEVFLSLPKKYIIIKQSYITLITEYKTFDVKLG